MNRFVSRGGLRVLLSAHAALPCTWSAHWLSARRASEKPARVFSMELNRLRSDYRRNSSRAQQEECLRVLSETPLHRVQGLDGKTVAHCLSTLALLDAPRDLPLLHDCAVWLSVHPDALPPHSLAQALHALVSLDYAELSPAVSAAAPALMAAAAAGGGPGLAGGPGTVGGGGGPGLAPSSLCMALSAALAAGGPAALIAALEGRALRLLADGLGATETALLAAALKAAPQPPPLRIAAAVWAKVAAADLRAVPLDDLVGLVAAAHAPHAMPHAMPMPMEQRAELKQRLRKEMGARLRQGPLVSARSAVLVAGIAQFVDSEADAPARDAIVAYVSSDAVTLDAAARILGAFAAASSSGSSSSSSSSGSSSSYGSSSSSCAGGAPPELVRYLVRAANEGREKWSAEAAHIVLRVFGASPARRADAMALAARRVDAMRSRSAAGAPVAAADVAALFVDGVVDPHAEALAAAVAANVQRWSVSQVTALLRAAAEVPGKPTRAVMRDVASRLAPFMEKATAAQLAAVAASYGRARVRNEAFCAAVAARAAVLAAELTLQQAGTILGALAAVEYRDTKLFVDLAPLVVAGAASAGAAETASLLAAYAKMLVWNFRVVWSLAERAAAIHDEFSLPQSIAVLVALSRMDVQHPPLTEALLQKVKKLAEEQPLALTESVMVLSAFSRSGAWDAAFFDDVGRSVVAAQQELTPDLLAETLMSYARVGLAQYNIFEELTLRALAVAPTSPPMALAHIAVAYAAVGCRHEELFTVIADRFISQKTEVPAVTIAAVLSAFATVGIRNDRLFIEAIPRVRHVGQYGTPKDITNVVYAYAQAGLWHYKLFVRLADRAIQLRGEFRCDHLVRLLKSYAKVDMRYEKLFLEFSTRIQTLAHLLTAGEVADIVSSYAKVRIPDEAVFKVCGDRAIELIDSFESDEARETLVAFKRAKVDHGGLEVALEAKFPQVVASLRQMSIEEEVDAGDVSASGADTPVASEKDEKIISEVG